MRKKDLMYDIFDIKLLIYVVFYERNVNPTENEKSRIIYV